MPAARREARVPNKQFASRTLLESGHFCSAGSQGGRGQGPRAGAPDPLEVPPDPLQDPKKHDEWFGVPNERQGWVTLASFTVLTGGLGPQAPMQMVSGALGSLGFRV